MREKLGPLGTYAGYLGMLICIIAVIGRFYGEKPILGFNASNMFVVGVGVMVWACWAKLEAGGRIGSGS